MIVFKEVAGDEQGVGVVLACERERAAECVEAGIAELLGARAELGEAGAELPIGGMNKAEHGSFLKILNSQTVIAISKTLQLPSVVSGYQSNPELGLFFGLFVNSLLEMRNAKHRLGEVWQSFDNSAQNPKSNR